MISIYFRSRCGGDCAIAKDPDGDEPVHMRDLQQGFSAGPEPAAPQKRAQPPVEAEAESQQGPDQEEGVHMPGEELRAPRAGPGPGRPDRDQEAFQPEARREEVEV